ncbi:protein of unknown function (plasmid) [Cupriavidus taiwanensis]|uniref:Uncharacterized protein n=1 Tax=Cupriavidus taiwanensis TaxID=164546 RepID=A0A375IMR3_9BURK|nr:hypothetical protein CBM2608_B100083 [Cupriavidus taiwanensis]SPA36660.1 hypothetical protein CBM2623_B90085 [Cupriavidus taiwanensis]SPK70215.1 hypothetical protein CT19425_U400032 [Cupriavidus taiwanensis]SPK74762.1 protein of unknown function [Cupriavidus taiwanensis]
MAGLTSWMHQPSPPTPLPQAGEGRNQSGEETPSGSPATTLCERSDAHRARAQAPR